MAMNPSHALLLLLASVRWWWYLSGSKSGIGCIGGNGSYPAKEEKLLHILMQFQMKLFNSILFCPVLAVNLDLSNDPAK